MASATAYSYCSTWKIYGSTQHLVGRFGLRTIHPLLGKYALLVHHLRMELWHRALMGGSPVVFFSPVPVAVKDRSPHATISSLKEAHFI